MSQNLIRAEKVLNFPNNVDYKARMSLDVVMNIENSLGSIMKLALRFSEGDVTQTEVMTILTLAIRGGGNDVKNSDIKNLMDEMGIPEATKMAGEVLAIALSTGDKVDEKKSEA